MKNILVLNGISYASAIEGLGNIHYSKKSFLSAPENFDLVLFTGGADVSPKLYDDTSPDGYCYTNANRDIEEIEVFDVALKHGVLMAGICRGVQFLNVMHGGKMMHHLDGHTGPNHRMASPVLADNIIVNTLHHQMIMPSEKAYVIGWSPNRLSSVYFGAADKEVEYNGLEIEAAIFPEIRALGVQYHPEMMDKGSSGYAFFYNMVKFALDHTIEEVVKAYTEGDASLEYLALCNNHVSVA